jgi:X-X-X-Leu-X-X-Gly heptad repeat protein
MWWRNSRLDRIEVNIERLAEISEATNRRIDRFVEVTAQQIEGLNARTERLEVGMERLQSGMEQLQSGMEQLQRAVEYLLSRDR